MIVNANVPIPGGDGLLLPADVYLPDRLPCPVVITRTPYDRGALAAHGIGWVRRGFAYLAQDVRGRYGADGQWQPYRHERADGRALLDWTIGQPWCDGRIVLAGASYGAFTAWAAALAAPGLASAVISEVPAAGLRAANTEPTGLLRLRESVGWWSEHADARTSRTALARTLAGSRDAGSVGAALAHLPVCEIGRRSWAAVPTWWSALQESAGEHGIRDDELAACPVPALHVGGWYDLFLPQTLRHWAVAGSAYQPRPPRGLVVGPWRHELSTPTSSAAGGREHGPASQLRLGELQAGWARAILAGDDPQLRKVFLVGTGHWLTEWPPAGSTRRWHTHPDGSLTRHPPGGTGTHRLRHDPRQPVPSIGPDDDRSRLDDRIDIIRFATPPTTHPLIVAGSPTLTLRVVDEAQPVDWIAHLVQRTAGAAYELTEGHAADVAGTRTVTIGMRPLAIALPAGARLELHLAASDFPRLARNLGTGRDRYSTAGTRPVVQAMLSGVDGTVLDLPVLDQPALDPTLDADTATVETR